MAKVYVKKSWHGDRIVATARKANRAAIITMAEGVQKEMKRAAHVETGALKRSITYKETPHAKDSVKVEVGSWLPYACVENNRGGTHRFADIGWQMAKRKFDKQLVATWQLTPGL